MSGRIQSEAKQTRSLCAAFTEANIRVVALSRGVEKATVQEERPGIAGLERRVHLLRCRHPNDLIAIDFVLDCSLQEGVAVHESILLILRLLLNKLLNQSGRADRISAGCAMCQTKSTFRLLFCSSGVDLVLLGQFLLHKDMHHALLQIGHVLVVSALDVVDDTCVLGQSAFGLAVSSRVLAMRDVRHPKVRAPVLRWAREPSAAHRQFAQPPDSR